MSEQLPISVLYVEDDADLRGAVGMYLTLTCQRVVMAADGREALASFRREMPDLMITDIRMPAMDGLELTQSVRALVPDIPVVLVTAFTEIPYLLQAIELGITAYVRKPIDYAQLLTAINAAVHPLLQRREIDLLRRSRSSSAAAYLGDSPQMQAIADQAMAMADNNSSVYLCGESGTGKRRLARLIHAMSPRSRAPFIAVACADRTEERLTEELFGRHRGLMGALAAAEDGTLFLHGIDRAPAAVQARLLHAFEQRAFLPMGAQKPVPCRARIISSGVHHPADAVSFGVLAAALSHLLADQILHLPALREMQNDLPLIARRFLVEATDDLHRPVPVLTPEALAILCNYRWPGNFRELQAVVRRAVLTAARIIDVPVINRLLTPADKTEGVPANLAKLERWAIEQALEQSGGRKMQAAQLLGVDYKRFKRMLARHGWSS